MAVKRKVVLMILPEFGFGGAEKSFSALSVMLEKYFEIQIVVFNKKIKPYYPIGGSINSLDVLESNIWLLKIFNFWKRVIRLRKLKKIYKPHTSISFLEGADYINILSKRSEKLILSIRGSKFHDENISGFIGWLRLNLLIPTLYQFAEHVVVVNHGLKTEMEKLVSADKITTITNIWDIDKIRKASQISLDPELEKSIKPNFIIAVGRLSAEKGFQNLIRVFAKIKSTLTDHQLVIVGDGKMHDALLQTCVNHKLTQNSNCGIDAPDVLFTGYQENPFNLMSKAKLFVLCSSAEGYPNTMIEAMSLGIPVMSTNCPYGPSEILGTHSIASIAESNPFDSAFGVLAPTFDKVESYDIWAMLINDLLNNKEKLQKYQSLSLERAYELKSGSQASLWVSLIDH